MRTTSDKQVNVEVQGETDRDLELLLQGERNGDEDGVGGGLILGRQGADLQELVLRIRIQVDVSVGTGRRYRTNDDKV